ncbi:MAG: universal stress protein [Solirubrobacterales bacterium]
MTPSENLVVVGYDGSESARAALGFGLEEARMRGAVLRVVWAWHHPLTTYMGGGFEPPGQHLSGEEFERTAREELQSALDESGAERAGVPAQMRVREGEAAAVVLEEAARATLLVVGSRGHGEVVGLLLGSVSQHCVAHAVCPVAVVPGVREADRRRSDAQ